MEIGSIDGLAGGKRGFQAITGPIIDLRIGAQLRDESVEHFPGRGGSWL